MKKLTQKEIAEKFKAIVVDKLLVDENEVTNDANFSNDLGADSLDIVELIMEVEKEFDIKVHSEFDDKLNTVNDIIIYIHNYISGKEDENYKYFKV
ncbi:MAG TPA: acyl carrier protein [Candidatus Absconditabacterales bacterium]|nr:acyl carrier protein [Candidatus Absconditabacterales bacterium]